MIISSCLKLGGAQHISQAQLQGPRKKQPSTYPKLFLSLETIFTVIFTLRDSEHLGDKSIFRCFSSAFNLLTLSKGVTEGLSWAKA